MRPRRVSSDEWAPIFFTKSKLNKNELVAWPEMSLSKAILPSFDKRYERTDWLYGLWRLAEPTFTDVATRTHQTSSSSLQTRLSPIFRLEKDAFPDGRQSQTDGTVAIAKGPELPLNFQTSTSGSIRCLEEQSYTINIKSSLKSTLSARKALKSLLPTVSDACMQ